MLLLSTSSFVVLLTFSSWLQDGCRTATIRSSHTAFKVRKESWHSHGVCLHVHFSDQKRNIFPKLSGDLHIYLIGENSVSGPPLSARLGKEDTWLSRSLSWRTDQGEGSKRSTNNACHNVQGYRYFDLHQVSDCFGTDQSSSKCNISGSPRKFVQIQIPGFQPHGVWWALQGCQSFWSVVLTSILIGSADIIISKRLKKKKMKTGQESILF